MKGQLIRQKSTGLKGVHERLAFGILTSAFLFTSGCAKQEPVDSANETREPAEVQAGVDKALATTGDLLTYTILVDYEEGLEIGWPEIGAEIAGFRIVDLGQEEQSTDGRVEEKRWYELRADLVGSYILPAVTIDVRNPKVEEESHTELVTSEIFVEVESVLPTEGEVTDIRGLKPLEPISSSRMFWILVVGGIVLLLLGAGLILRYRRKKQGVEEVLPEPHEVAFEALRRLKKTNFEDVEAVREYYFQISEVLRTYVEGRFGLNATDLTTDEILGRMTELADVPEDQRQHLRFFLLETDRVKFAAHTPSEQEISESYETALRFVEASVPKVEPMEVAA